MTQRCNDLPFLAFTNRLAATAAGPRFVETEVPLFVTAARPLHVQGLRSRALSKMHDYFGHAWPSYLLYHAMAAYDRR